MAESSGTFGLRERKKLRTRATLIEAAAELCLKQGYDNTTVEQIAAVADVSPRTFSRYFPTKESVIIAMSGDMDELVAEALARQPTGITEYEALLRAFLDVFGPYQPYQTPGFKRMAVLIQIINNAASLRASAFLHQRPIEERTALSVMGQRMGLAPTHPAVRLISDTWTVLFTNAFAGLGTPGHDPLEPRVLCDRLHAQYDLFRRTWSPWITEDAGDRNPTQARQVDSDYLPVVTDSFVPVDNRRRG
ncbi:MAG: TetR family transcriptional regulator [Mycobacterium sp.]